MFRDWIDAHETDEYLIDYLFDLNGYLIIKGAIVPQDLQEMNQWVDEHWDYVSGKRRSTNDEAGTWIGNIETHTYSGPDGCNFQNIIEGGPVFQRLINYPAWINLCRRWVNPVNGLSIHENFLNVRGADGYIGIHSGGATPISYMTFRQANTGEWMVGQINIISALEDIGPGDGPTTLIPGSHKSAMRHPKLLEQVYRSDAAAGEQMGMSEMYLKAGDTLLFTDAITHGSAARTNDGYRRIVLYRYSPGHLATRFNYVPSDTLLTNLTEEQRKIIQPTPLRYAPGRRMYDSR